MKVLPAKKSELSWVEQRASCTLSSNATGIKVVRKDGSIAGMVAYDSWTKNSVQAHMAVESPIAWRALAPETFRYPFEQVGIGVILGVIPAYNQKSLTMAKRLGLVETYRVPNGWDTGVDLVLLELAKENCRWLSGSRKAA